MNNTSIIGNLTKDPELRTTSNGQQVCELNVAVNDRINGNDVVTYYRCGVWGKTGEACNTYLTKGSKVFISGRVTANAYISKTDGQAKASLNLFANSVEFLSSRPTGTAQAPAAPQAQARPTAQPQQQFTPVEDVSEGLPW